ncbi:FAD-dependent oxidoreductase [Micromonospora sp. NPDC047074]|uniref:FAD-dependent oxidoreductase n=1 Tax=Micromonospora sp. NPDC047074 TaxID=3154339 RepID=UPI0034072236
MTGSSGQAAPTVTGPPPASGPATVIVGSGNAGLAAAVRLSQRGVPAILVEKNARLGGQLHLSGGAFSAAGTRRQAARGIQDSPAEHYADVLRISHGTATAPLVRLATEHAATAVDWLDALGFPFVDECPAIVRGHEPYGRARTYWGAHPRNGGAAILETLLPHLDRAVVEVRTGEQVVEILTETGTGAPRVTGIRTIGPAGERVVPATTVIMATGGYAASRELLAQLQPRYAQALVGCLPHATGDGHRMLMDLGVPMTGQDTYLPTMGMIEDPDSPGYAFPLTRARLVVDANARLPWEIWVNAHGERFVDETGLSPDHRERALLRQPELSMWGIWNEAALRHAPSSPIGPDWTAEQVRAEAAAGRWLHRADSVAELARMVGLPPAALSRTLAGYATDQPDPFGRTYRPDPLTEPPFYAVRTTGAMLLSRGGPVVDELLRPVTTSGASVEGLHAIGELLGMGQFSGDAFAGGMSVGPALTFGVWIADRLAEQRQQAPAR